MIKTDSQKIKEILERGVEEIIDRNHLETALKSGKKLRVKLGIDPTGPKIHIGRAIQLWKLRAFQELGHQVVLIIGDFTALIGDASDKTSMRKPLIEKEVKENMKTYLTQIGKILNLRKTEVKHNSKWLNKLTFKDYLELAMKFTAQQLIQRRNFKERWNSGNPIGAHEMAYPIIQGYDSVKVSADLEIGGSDQLFNLKTGREIQKIFKQPAQDIMTLKMLYGLDGRKMSTSWGNVVNISDEPLDMYGKIMSMKDELIDDYLELTTNLLKAEIEEIKELANPRDKKARLAKEMVKMYHGEKEAEKAEEEFNKIFRDKEMPSEIPFFETQKKEMAVLDLLFESGLLSSKSEAKRLIEEGGIRINSQTITDWRKNIEIKDGMVIQAGKRKFIKIKKK